LSRLVSAARALLTGDSQCNCHRCPRPSDHAVRLGFSGRLRVGADSLVGLPERRAKLPIRDEDMLPLPQRLNRAQQVVLAALTKNSVIWNRSLGNAYLAFRRVQLPQDRAKILQCLAAERS